MWFNGLLNVGLGVLVSKREEDSSKKCEIIGWHTNGYFIISGEPYNEAEVGNNVYIKFISKGILYSCNATIKFIHEEPFKCFILEVPEEVTTFPIRKETRFDAYILGTMIRLMNDKNVRMNILLKDISPSGALIEVRGVCRNCVVNEKIIISFPLPDGKMISELPAEIRNIRKQEDKAIIGVQFKRNNNKEYDDILDFFEKEAPFFA